jgi:Ni2+-binding GTPase involved in maturation of urease and hydrogenase
MSGDWVVINKTDIADARRSNRRTELFQARQLSVAA